MNLRELRESERFTKVEVGKRIGIHANTLYLYEKGERNIPYLLMIELAKVYNVPMATIEQAVLKTHDERKRNNE